MRAGAAILLALWSLQAAAQNSPSSLERTLVDASLSGYVEFDVMAIRFPAEAEALAEKMQKALDERPEWYREYGLKHINDHPFPYHENFGLTEAEYLRFLELGEDRHFEPALKVNLGIRDLGDGRFRLNGGRQMAPYTGVEFDVRRLTARVPGREQPIPGEAFSAGMLDPVGKVSGYRWHFEAGDIYAQAPNIQVIDLRVFLNGTGRLVFEYTNKKTVNGELELISEYILASTGKTSRSGNR